MLSFLPYETWIGLLKTCQRTPSPSAKPLGRHLREDQSSSSVNKSQSASRGQTGSESGRNGRGKARELPLFPLRQRQAVRLQSPFAKEFVGAEQYTWTRHTSKRRALMILSDMWRYSGTIQPVDDDGQIVIDKATADIDGKRAFHRRDHYSSWRPSAYHYNVVLDVINHDPTSKIDEMVQLYRDMKARGVREDTITLNTILNGCRRLGDWASFASVEKQMRRLDEAGVTRMDTHSWSTLIQGYKEMRDWESVDRCTARATSACHEWLRAQRKKGAEEEAEGSGIEPTVQLWSTIITTYADRNMVPQMLAARRVMSGLGLRATAYVYGPVFAALHKARQTLVRKGRDSVSAMRLALSEYEAMQSEGVEPNEAILTNIVLTIGFGSQSQSEGTGDNRETPDERQNRAAVLSQIMQRLESILVQAHNPQIYAALISIAGRARRVEEVQYFWRTLTTEARLPRVGRQKGAQNQNQNQNQNLVNSLTLASYMGALISCRQHSKAVAVFFEHAFSRGGDSTHRALFRPASSSLKVASINRDVYETSLKAFALADQHTMCPVVISRMIAGGMQPTVLSLRHSLLPPAAKTPSRSGMAGFRRSWTLPFDTASDIWALVLPTRQRTWARKRLFRGALGSGDEMPDDDLPVITNDVSSQLIRVAAAARNTRFGEQVFAAFDSEISYFGTRRRSGLHEANDSSSSSGGSSGSGSGDSRSRFPSHMQCEPNVHTYTSMIALYAATADMDGVARMWSQMLSDGVEPNLHTYTSLVVALHKHALRKRWRSSREYESSGGSSNGGARPWSPTKHDRMIDSIEDWFVSNPSGGSDAAPIATTTSEQTGADGAGSDDARKTSTPDWLQEMEPLDLDIPLSTLLLRYRTMRIRETMGKLSEDAPARKPVFFRDNAISQIQRAMELCQKVESVGLVPDFKFQAALADLFDACGDKPGAELVRRRMDEIYKRH
ncbi:hypothetical protein IWW48_005011 [Coemansia sp. RSA 1200]|nr:hypothetical protein IWW48_005011 [Coemansia sp. RSA 1200]